LRPSCSRICINQPRNSSQFASADSAIAVRSRLIVDDGEMISFRLGDPVFAIRGKRSFDARRAAGCQTSELTNEDQREDVAHGLWLSEGEATRKGD
jgi:hypothetical protein